MTDLSPLAQQLYNATPAAIAEALRYLRKDAEVVADLVPMAQGCVLTCVYCGHEYPAGTPASGAPALTDHIRTCDKHPLRAAEATISRLRSVLAGVVGASDPEELKAMEAVVRTQPAPDQDKAVIINAIHALIDHPVPALTDEAIREEWRAAGGDMHGPIVEHVSMPEAAYFTLRRKIGGVAE